MSAQALVSFRGNCYSVPPELAHGTVTVVHRLGCPDRRHRHGGRDRHRPAPTWPPTGAGASVRDSGHVTALNTAALAAFTTREAAPAQAAHPTQPGRARRRRSTRPTSPSQAAGNTSTVIDLATYAAAAAGRNTLT